ncbi:hypothetical protein BDN71DRAFT_1458417 [Pleurotus eryngii]|uniref:Ribonuclease H1 N-terminal domain-containing protein n=1 Tax=Pleurotus eryngii TaxID=5323 RepID=A0A9P6D1K8_PLEER|nr:hypothetical protein BDN71DRAFT_1458417 [Pleurotus eryngii]
MCQFALMFPAFTAAATSAPPAAPTATIPVVAATTTAPVVAATTTAPVVAAPVAAPTALLSSQEAESQIIDISAGAVFCCPSCDAVHYLIPSQSGPSDTNDGGASSVSAVASGSTVVSPSNVLRTGHFSAATGSAGDHWYGVVVGRQVGVFQNWQDLVEDLVAGVLGCKYKGFSSFAAAERFFLDHLHIARIHPHPH